MNDAVYQLGAYPRGARCELALREAALYLAENIQSLTDYARPWIKALEPIGGGAEGLVVLGAVLKVLSTRSACVKGVDLLTRV